MQDPHTLRDLAKRCRSLAMTSMERGVIEQLRLWAIELADAADEVERSAAQQRSVIMLRKRIS
jgi:hypothetical protein